MQELLLVNPKRRTRRKSRKTASPAQRRARAAFAARARAKNPIRRRARAASAPAVRTLRNPIRSVRRHVARRRRNPIGGFAGTAIDMVKDAAIGGAGAIAVDMVAGQVKSMLPLSLQTGNGYMAAKAALTVGLGILSRRMIGSVGMAAARGALTVQAYTAMKPYVPASMPLGYLAPSPTMPGARSGKPMAVSGGLRGLRGMASLAPASGSMAGLGALETSGADFLRPR